MIVDLNIYLVLALNSFLSGLCGALGSWAYHTHIKKYMNKLTKKNKQ